MFLENARAWIYLEINKRLQSSTPRKTTSKPQTGTKPTTPWWLVRCFNHWATKTQMVSQGASLIYMCNPSGSHYTLIMIDEVYVFRKCKSLDISWDRWMITKLHTQKNDFWAPNRDQTCNPKMTSETLQPLSHQGSDGEPSCKFDIYVWHKRKPLYIVTHICQICTLAYHLSLGGLMVGASHQSSEGCRFGPHLGLGSCFSGCGAWQSFIYLNNSNNNYNDNYHNHNNSNNDL